MLIFIKSSLNHSGNHRCILQGVGRVPRTGKASSLITRVCPAPTAGTTGIAGGRHGVLSKGFGPDGRRRRYKVSGRTKQDVIEALKKKSEELDAGLSTPRSYTVGRAAHDWLEHGFPGRSERTRKVYRDALAPLRDKIGKRPLRDLTAGEVEAGLRWLAGSPSSQSLQRPGDLDRVDLVHRIGAQQVLADGPAAEGSRSGALALAAGGR
jgi:hypothetical protein